MDAATFVHTVQLSWLVLCGMMLFSRFVFQAAGPTWMRAFLDGWKTSRTHQAWGVVALLYGVALAALGARVLDALGALDLLVALPLVAVLCADGLLNLLPSWFGNFKERMQDAWVRRHAATERAAERATDRHLFGTVNLALGAASVAMAASIHWYRPLTPGWLLLAAAIATLVMTVLIVGARCEARAQGRGAQEHGAR